MVDQILGSLFGGQNDDDDTTRRGRATDFVSRYEQGAPWDNISGDEALHNYQNVAEQLSPEEYESAAAETFARLSPQERQQFAAFLQQRSGQQVSANVEDPNDLARMTTQLRQNSSGGLLDLLGGGGALGGLLGGGGGQALGGILGGGSQGRSSGGGGDLGDLVNSPIGKAVLGGIAAMAMRKFVR